MQPNLLYLVDEGNLQVIDIIVDGDIASLLTASTGGLMNHPNKAKSFPAATVPAVAKLEHRRHGKRGARSEERRNARRAHASEQSVDDGEVEAW